MTSAPPVSSARGARILHGALVLGSIMVGAVFFYLVRTLGPSFPNAIVAYVTAAVALVNMTFAVAFFRPRIPERRTDEAPDDYWSRNEVRGAAVIIWAMVEAAGLLAWVGYLLTGNGAPAAVGLLAIGALILTRTARIEGEGA